MFPLVLLAISTIGFMLEAGMPLAVDAQTVALQAVEQALPQAKELVEHIILTTQGFVGVLRLRLIALGLAVSTGLLLILFTLLYRFLPRAPLRFADVWPAAIVATVGWELLKRGFAWYTTSLADSSQLFGPIAGVIGLLLWLYLSAQVLLFGAEFSAAYSHLLAEKHAATSTLTIVEKPTKLSYVVSTTPPVPSRASRGADRAGGGLARGTAAGMVGAGIAGGLIIGALLATGRRLLTRLTTAETVEGAR